MIWLLPLVPDQAEVAPQVPSAADMLARAVLNALVDLARAPDWIIEKTARTAFAGHFALQIEAVYKGRHPLAESVAKFVQQQLSLNLLFQKANPALHVTEIPWLLWQSTLTLEETEVAPIEPSPESEEEIAGTPADFSHRLFTKRDLQAWSAKVAAGSEWTMSARRLRTLLLRMISYGYVGIEGIESEQIWSGLPDAHSQPLRALLPGLVEAEFLISVMSQALP
jgi:hypothetical protein